MAQMVYEMQSRDTKQESPTKADGVKIKPDADEMVRP